MYYEENERRIHIFLSLRDVSVGQRFQMLARTIALSGVSFGFFLAVGSAIRCESAGLRQKRRPLAVTIDEEARNRLKQQSAALLS
jgi:hypothetical protein